MILISLISVWWLLSLYDFFFLIWVNCICFADWNFCTWHFAVVATMCADLVPERSDWGCCYKFCTVFFFCFWLYNVSFTGWGRDTLLCTLLWLVVTVFMWRPVSITDTQWCWWHSGLPASGLLHLQITISVLAALLFVIPTKCKPNVR